MATPDDIAIRELTPMEAAGRLPELAELLHACVHAGASVNFVLPFTPEDSLTFWLDKVLPAMRTGHRHLLAAERDGQVVGSVQLDHATQPNQPHRAEVTKLLVHPTSRRRGLGNALMLALEDVARRQGRHLITLDTRTGDAAEPLYTGLGYRTVGVIPGYSRAPRGDDLDATTLMYKTL